MVTVLLPISVGALMEVYYPKIWDINMFIKGEKKTQTKWPINGLSKAT